MVRARAVHLNSDNGDSTGRGLSVNNKWMPEVDVSYFFNPNMALELVLTVPQKHTLHFSALGADLGTLKHLPPTLISTTSPSMASSLMSAPASTTRVSAR